MRILALVLLAGVCSVPALGQTSVPASTTLSPTLTTQDTVTAVKTTEAASPALSETLSTVDDLSVIKGTGTIAAQAETMHPVLTTSDSVQITTGGTLSRNNSQTLTTTGSVGLLVFRAAAPAESLSTSDTAARAASTSSGVVAMLITTAAATASRGKLVTPSQTLTTTASVTGAHAVVVNLAAQNLSTSDSASNGHGGTANLAQTLTTSGSVNTVHVGVGNVSELFQVTHSLGVVPQTPTKIGVLSENLCPTTIKVCDSATARKQSSFTQPFSETLSTADVVLASKFNSGNLRGPTETSQVALSESDSVAVSWLRGKQLAENLATVSSVSGLRSNGANASETLSESDIACSILGLKGPTESLLTADVIAVQSSGPSLKAANISESLPAVTDGTSQHSAQHANVAQSSSTLATALRNGVVTLPLSENLPTIATAVQIRGQIGVPTAEGFTTAASLAVTWLPNRNLVQALSESDVAARAAVLKKNPASENLILNDGVTVQVMVHGGKRRIIIIG